jgi:hypothetical protein
MLSVYLSPFYLWVYGRTLTCGQGLNSGSTKGTPATPEVEKLGSPGRVGMVTAAPLLVVVVVVVFVVVFAGKMVKCVFTMHCTENQIYVFTEKELRGLSPNSYIHVSVNDLYISRIGPHIWLQQNGQTDPGNI